MQKIFLFEISTALKDRPRFFQIITLVLFAFSLTMIVVCSLARLSSAESDSVFENRNASRYAELAASPAQPLLHLEK